MKNFNPLFSIILYLILGEIFFLLKGIIIMYWLLYTTYMYRLDLDLNLT